jgi:hypothetical protein
LRTAIDTNVFSSIWSGEPTSRELAARLGAARLEGALLISPAVFAELHAYPGATHIFVANFLKQTSVVVDFRLEEEVWIETGKRFARYAARRRESQGNGPRRLLADFLVGAHALVQADRLMTLDAKMYQQNFPEVRLI